MARAKGVIIEGDLAENNLKHISAFDPKATASTYRDYKAGRKSEIDGIFFDVVRESRALGFEAPAFALVAEKLGFRE